MIPAVFVRREQLAPRIVTYWFEPERRLRFTAGQFTELTVPHKLPDNRGATRQFTISSSPKNPLIGITVSFPAQKPSNFKQALRALRAGDSVLLSEPLGDFVLPKLAAPVTFIAGGVGITPVLSIAQWLQDTANNQRPHIMHVARNQDTLLGRELLNSIGMYQPILTQAAPAWRGRVAKLGPTLLQDSLNPTQVQQNLFYISGPDTMVQQTAQSLQNLGVNKPRIVTDVFLGTSFS